MTFQIRLACCHSKETHAPISNLPNSAQLGGTPYNSPRLRPDMRSSVGMHQGTDTPMGTTSIRFACLCLMQNVMTSMAY